MQQRTFRSFLKNPGAASAAICLIIFAGMMILFRPGIENIADRETGSAFFSVYLAAMCVFALWSIGYVSFEVGRSVTGRLMALGCLFYLSFECCVRINSVKTLIIIICAAVFCLVRGRGKILPAVLFLLFIALLAYLVCSSLSGGYSISRTMPPVGPFVFGELRYHNPISALKDYLKYEPRNVIQVPMLYLELFLSYFVWMYAGDPESGSRKKARWAVIVSMACWIAVIFVGRLFSFLGYYWVYACAFIPSVLLLMYFVRDVQLPDEKRIYIHVILLLMVPAVVISVRFADVWRSSSPDDAADPVYLYEVNPYELPRD